MDLIGHFQKRLFSSGSLVHTNESRRGINPLDEPMMYVYVYTNNMWCISQKIDSNDIEYSSCLLSWNSVSRKRVFGRKCNQGMTFRGTGQERRRRPCHRCRQHYCPETTPLVTEVAKRKASSRCSVRMQTNTHTAMGSRYSVLGKKLYDVFGEWVCVAHTNFGIPAPGVFYFVLVPEF